MRTWIVAIGLGGVMALAACNERQTLTLDPDGAVLCPGGANCPAESAYVGLLLPANSIQLTQGAEGGVIRVAAAPSEGGGAALAPETGSLRTDPPPFVPVKKFCPGGSKCDKDESGLQWATANGQILCTADKPCVTDSSGNGVPTFGNGNGEGPPMPKGYIGWLCKKSEETDCSDLPQRPR